MKIEDPNGDIPDVPENYLTVVYDLKPSGTSTILTVTQGDYSKVAQGEKRYQESLSAGGWKSILEQIKVLVEEKGLNVV